MTPKEKAIKYFMKEEVRLIETGTIPEYPLQLDETIEEALKEQAKQLVEKIEKEIQRLETEEDKNKDLWEDGRIDGSIKTLRWVLQEMKK